MREVRLVQRILAGDKAAGERLVCDNYRRVFTMLRALTEDGAAAEDLTQQTFVAVWTALPGFRGDSRLATWISRIAYHQYTHWLRDRRAHQSLDSIELLADPRSAAGLENVLFACALRQLSDDLRVTFLMRYQNELDIREISAILELPAGTVKSRLHTARSRLRELLAESMDSRESETAPPDSTVYPKAEEVPT